MKILKVIGLFVIFNIGATASDRSITEILKDDGEISILYTNGTSRFIKTEDDLKLFVLVKSYKSHLYEIRHSDNAPTFADYTNNYYAESIYTVILTELAKFSLNDGQYANSSNVIFVGGDVKEYTPANYNYLMLVNVLNRIIQHDKLYNTIVYDTREVLIKENIYDVRPILNAESDIRSYIKHLRLNEFIDCIKKAKAEKSICGFINGLSNVEAKITDEYLDLNINYKVV